MPTTHTPGPWKWLTTDKFFSLIVEEPERFEIEGPLPYLDREINPTADRMFADARLIAAAPLLLAEVKRLEKRQSALVEHLSFSVEHQTAEVKRLREACMNCLENLVTVQRSLIWDEEDRTMDGDPITLEALVAQVEQVRNDITEMIE